MAKPVVKMRVERMRVFGREEGIWGVAVGVLGEIVLKWCERGGKGWSMQGACVNGK